MALFPRPPSLQEGPKLPCKAARNTASTIKRLLSLSSSGRGDSPALSEILASHAEGFHLRVLLEPCVNLSAYTAPDVQPSA